MARPGKTPRGQQPDEGTPVQVTTEATVSCATCHAQVAAADVPLHTYWHEGLDTKIKKTARTIKREPRLRPVSEEV